MVSGTELAYKTLLLELQRALSDLLKLQKNKAHLESPMCCYVLLHLEPSFIIPQRKSFTIVVNLARVTRAGRPSYSAAQMQAANQAPSRLLELILGAKMSMASTETTETLPRLDSF